MAATWKQIDAAVAGMTSDGMREHDVYVFAEWRVITLPNQWGNVAVYVTYSDNEPFAHAYCDIHGV